MCLLKFGNLFLLEPSIFGFCKTDFYGFEEVFMKGFWRLDLDYRMIIKD